MGSPYLTANLLFPTLHCDGAKTLQQDGRSRVAGAGVSGFARGQNEGTPALNSSRHVSA